MKLNANLTPELVKAINHLTDDARNADIYVEISSRISAR